MSRRKGEMNKLRIDSGWPHQVAIPAYVSMGKGYDVVHGFCKNLSLCPRGFGFRRGDQDWNVFCFAEAVDAEAFAREFGGELMTPKTRPKWPG